MATSRYPSDVVGRVLDGRYRIGRPIAEGGMSAVYEGEQLNVSRKVAIKILKPEISRDRDMLARFRSEARIISGLRHPNTLKLIDYGSTEDGLLYLVTELLSGEPLSLRLKRGPLSPKDTLHILKEVLRSLNEAHERGVIHRDLKPGNLFLEAVAGQTLVKVLDFGIAKMKARQAEDPEQPTTAAGLLLGTPAYLSPEQASGKAVDARSDIYSLGAVAYHCLSGQVPFQGEAVAQIMAHVSRPPTPFDELVPAAPVPESVAKLVYRWMAKKPSGRPKNAQVAFQEASAVYEELYGSGRPEATPPFPDATPRRSASALWAVIAFVVLGAGAVFGLRALDQGFGGRADAAVSPHSDAGHAGLPVPDALRDAGSDAAVAGLDAGAPGPAPDAETTVTPATGARVLERPISGPWRSSAAVEGVLREIEPRALDCYRRTQRGESSGRTVSLTFIVRDAGVSVRVVPADKDGQAFRKCLSFRLPRTLPWPPRRDTSTAGLVIGEETPL